MPNVGQFKPKMSHQAKCKPHPNLDQSKPYPSLDQWHPPELKRMGRKNNLINVLHWTLDLLTIPFSKTFLSTSLTPEKTVTHPRSHVLNPERLCSDHPGPDNDQILLILPPIQGGAKVGLRLYGK